MTNGGGVLLDFGTFFFFFPFKSSALPQLRDQGLSSPCKSFLPGSRWISIDTSPGLFLLVGVGWIKIPATMSVQKSIVHAFIGVGALPSSHWRNAFPWLGLDLYGQSRFIPIECRASVVSSLPPPLSLTLFFLLRSAALCRGSTE